MSESIGKASCAVHGPALAKAACYLKQGLNAELFVYTYSLGSQTDGIAVATVASDLSKRKGEAFSFYIQAKALIEYALSSTSTTNERDSLSEVSRAVDLLVTELRKDLFDCSVTSNRNLYNIGHSSSSSPQKTSDNSNTVASTCEPNESEMDFTNMEIEQIFGASKAQDALLEAVYPFAFPHLIKLFHGIRQPSSTILLYGPPGTGKTTLVQLIAKNMQLKVFAMTPATVLSKWVGESVKSVRKVFMAARKNSPSIIFVDELDTLACSRASGDDTLSRQVLGEMLMEISKIRKQPVVKNGSSINMVVFVAATNRLGDIDPALLRRFDRVIEVELPNRRNRGEIIRDCLKGVNHSLIGNDMSELSKKTEGWSGGDIKMLVRYACMIPVHEVTANIKSNDFLHDICLREVNKDDFATAFHEVQPVSKSAATVPM